VSTDLWNFSLKVYAQDGVPAECLHLQDTHGIDVNLLLFCAWLGAVREISVSSRDIAAALDIVKNWNSEIVTKIRDVRRALKPLDAEALRDKIKAAELDAERVEQAMLENWATTYFVGRQTSKDALRTNVQTALAFYNAAGSMPIRLIEAAQSISQNN
jgi:uncharacterized protein (TIGR02444 family)